MHPSASLILTTCCHENFEASRRGRVPIKSLLKRHCTPPGDVGYIPDIYQVRGFDLSDISFVKGRTGWIVFDPLISAETARAAVRVEKFWLRVHEKVWGA